MSDKFTLQESHGQLHGEIKTSVVTVSGGPTLLPSLVSGRKDVTLYNAGTGPVYVGGVDVTINDGLPLVAGSELQFAAGRVEIYAVASGTNQLVRVFEIS